MGTLYKRDGSRKWMMAVTVGGRQVCKSTHTTNKCLAGHLLARWETEVFEGRFHLPQSKPPLLELYATDFLASIRHPNTRRRYASSSDAKVFANLSPQASNEVFPTTTAAPFLFPGRSTVMCSAANAFSYLSKLSFGQLFLLRQLPGKQHFSLSMFPLCPLDRFVPSAIDAKCRYAARGSPTES